MISLKRTSISLLTLLSAATIVGSCRSRETSQTKDIFTATSEGSVYVYRRSDNKIQIRKCPDYAPLKEASKSEDVEKQLAAYCPETNANQKEFPLDTIKTKLAENYAKSYIPNDKPIDKELVDAKLSAEQLKQQSIDQANQQKDKTLANIKALQEEITKLEAYFANNPELLNDQIKSHLAELKNQLSTHQTALAALSPEAIQATAEIVRANAWAESYANFMQKNLFQILFDNNQMKKISAADPLQKRLFDTLGELWNLEAVVTFIGFDNGTNNSINPIAFSPDGNLVLIGFKGYERKYGVETEKEGIFLYDLKGKLIQKLEGRSAIFSPDGKTILTSVSDRVAKFRDLNGNLTRTINTGAYGDKFTFSPDGTKFLSIAKDGIAKLWDLDGVKLQEFKTDATVTSVAFSPNGAYIIAGDTSGKKTIWDLQGKVIEAWSSRDKMTGFVTYFPDGTKILTRNYYDRFVEIRDLNTKQIRILTTTTGHYMNNHYNLKCVALSPDGTKIVSSGSETTIWNIDGSKIKTLKMVGDVDSVYFSPDSKKIITGSSSTVQLWDPDLTF